MLENYLLHPNAICAALSELGCQVAPEAVEARLAQLLDPADVLELDGASVLTNVFSNLSNTTLEFRKTRDVPTLVTWLLGNAPEHLIPLRDCLRKTFFT